MTGKAAFVLWTGNHHKTGLSFEFSGPQPLAAAHITAQKHCLVLPGIEVDSEKVGLSDL